MSNGCDGTISCGTCGTGQTCDGAMCRCQQESATNLLVNPGFDGTTSPWATHGAAAVAYSQTDVASCSGSGSVVVDGIDLIFKNGNSNLRQCVTTGIQPSQPYVFGFQFNGAPGGASAYCSLTVYSGAGCTGDSSTPEDSNGNSVGNLTATSNGNTWAAGTASFVTNAGARSTDVFCSGANGSGCYDRFF